jgi:hypothetical protein
LNIITVNLNRKPDVKTETDTDRDRQRQTETDRDRQRQTETDRDRQRQTERRQRDRETDTQTYTQTRDRQTNCNIVFTQNSESQMSEEEMLSKFEGITLRVDMNRKIPKVTAIRLLISLAGNFESNDQVKINYLVM